MKNQKLLLWSLLGLVFLYLLNFRLTSDSGEHWTVYGSNGCGWTRKQLSHMKKKRISYTFVDCEVEDCGKINSYPTMKSSSGKVLVGFNKV